MAKKSFYPLILALLFSTFNAYSSQPQNHLASRHLHANSSASKPVNNELISQQAQPDSSQQLNQLFKDYQQEFLRLHPFEATFRGIMQYNDQFGEHLTDKYFAQSKALNQKYLNRIGAINFDTLNRQEQLSYKIFRYSREQVLNSQKNGSTLMQAMMPVNQVNSVYITFSILGSGQSAQPFHTVKDYENWIVRAKGFNSYVSNAISRMQQGIKQGVVMPTLLMQKTLPQLEAQANVAIEKSAFYLPITNLPESFSEADKKRLTIAYKALIKQHIQPAYQALADYVKNDYMPHTRKTYGVGLLPGGKVFYKQAIETMTTTDLTADAIHQMGLKKTSYLYSEMEKVKDKVGFKGSMQEFFNYLETAKQFYYTQADDLVEGYKDLRNIINPTLKPFFNIFPKSEYVIKPFRESIASSMPPAQYISGSADGSRPGTFYVNTYQLSARPKWNMTSLSLHEASPGHHFQLSINQESTTLPPFRQFAYYNAYSEGWALYCEALGVELGVYSDPYHYFGMLFSQIWRANRLVVDTGIHYKGWSRKQAIDFMTNNSPMSRDVATAEVDRYIAVPAQALGYMIGSMKILQLRKNAEKELGKNFDIKEFHRQILIDGGMPLSTLEWKIQLWIEKQKQSVIINEKKAA